MRSAARRAAFPRAGRAQLWAAVQRLYLYITLSGRSYAASAIFFSICDLTSAAISFVDISL